MEAQRPVAFETADSPDVVAVGWKIWNFKPALAAGTILIGSGIFHFGVLAVTRSHWQGPLSPRKPALFGVSAGVTCWSLAWVMTRLRPMQRDRIVISAMTGSLLLEVGLITMQYWRGVPSHFNRSTPFDAEVERLMLILILGVTAGIGWLCWRSIRLPAMEKSQAIALRWGLWFLLISCLLGGVATVAGKMNLASGRPPEIWGAAGVLKYPHGAALHALQTLPILCWGLNRLRVPRQVLMMRSAVASQMLSLVYAIRQTAVGRSRFDFDSVGGLLIGMTLLFAAVPAFVLVKASVAAMRSGVVFKRLSSGPV